MEASGINTKRNSSFFIPTIYNNFKRRRYAYGLVTSYILVTEADTITKTFNQDWGGYSDVLRKGFHAEPITKSRLTNLEYSEIKEPKFSLTMTGTPNQMNTLITSIEDGLFSRIMFYSYISEPV